MRYSHYDLSYRLATMLLGNILRNGHISTECLFILLPVFQPFLSCMYDRIINRYIICLLGKLSSMGYGFIQYKTPKAAQKAIRQLQVGINLTSVSPVYSGFSTFL